MSQLRRQQHFGTLLRLSPQAIVILDADGLIREWNPAAVDLLGWRRDDVVGQPLTAILGVEGRERFADVWAELRAERAASPLHGEGMHRDRTAVPVEVLLAPIQDSDGSFAGVVGTLSSTVPRPREGLLAVSAAEAPSLWDVDEVTGLPGRRWLQRRLLAPIPDGQVRAVALLDLDGFALVNQDYGTETGDRVLAELARRLRDQCAPAGVGRWQADEFLLVLDGVAAADDLLALLEAAGAAAVQPLVLEDHQIRLTFSAGVATTASVPGASLVRSATAAMSEAKAQGRDLVVLFDEQRMTVAANPGLRLAHDLQHGMAHGELELHFQPIVHLATNDVVGVEALVRWARPGVGLFEPASFIEVAERTGQIVALGALVARSACEAVVALAAESLAPLSVSINVSARQLNDPGLLTMLQTACSEAGCDPRSLVIEVTETALLQDLSAVAGVLEEIRETGMAVDLDDFGTGYSSLLYLKHLPVNRIKIDQEFVSGLGTDIADMAIVTSTIALAHSMGISAVAEGVETPEQLQLLRQLGCDYVQGFLVSHPLPQAELLPWLARQLPSRLLDRSVVPGQRAGAEADHRETAADGRDAAGDRRDLAGDLRDLTADHRDTDSDLRDDERDERDALADRREELADAREGAALGGASGATGHTGRARAASARAVAAVQRGEARAERDVAEADRQARTTEREAEARAAVGGGSGWDEEEGRRATFDALTGAYLWGVGQAALETEALSARALGETVAVVHVAVQEGPDREQLAQDSGLVVVANVLGAALRPRDVLVRKTATELVCLLRGLSASELESWLADVAASLGAVPQLSTPAVMRSVTLGAGESATAAIMRAQAARPTGGSPA